MLTRRVVLASMLGPFLPQAAMAQKGVTSPPARDDGWPVADPRSVGLDPTALADLVDQIDAGVTFPNIHAVLIEHQGRLVFEHYWPGADGEYGFVDHGPETLHDLRSISKGVTSLILGVALGNTAQNVLGRSIQSLLADRYKVPGALADITLRDVLTMTAGLAWNEARVPFDSRNDYIKLVSTSDPIGFVLSKERRGSPGSVWTYNSGLTDLTAAVIEQLTGRTFLDYAEAVLFDPLGISTYEWWRPPAWPADSFPSASAGLRLRARDLAKIASLTRNRGTWRGQSIVPSAWIDAATTRHADTRWARYGYGYFWYRGKLISGHNTIRASGYGDQELILLPEADISITIFAGSYDDPNWAVGERIAGRVIRALR